MSNGDALVFILFICIPTFTVGGCAVRLSSIILDWDQGSKPLSYPEKR